MGDDLNKTKLTVGIIVTIAGVVLLWLYFIYAYRFTYNAVFLQIYVGTPDVYKLPALDLYFIYQISSIVTLITGGSLLLSSWK